jgi:hypothetical protein
MNGLPMPQKPRVSAPATKPSTTRRNNAKPLEEYAARKRRLGVNSDLDKIADIHLSGEDKDKVPIFDSCAEIRRKITVYLQRECVTRTDFFLALGEQLKTESPELHRQNLAEFRGQTGLIGGANSPFYYACYVFFEKLRIAEGKEKTAHRTQMEAAWGSKGVDRKWPEWMSYGQLLANLA